MSDEMETTIESPSLLVSGLKRKSENAGEEPHLEAAIKRVALNEEDIVKDNITSLKTEDDETSDGSRSSSNNSDLVNLRMLCLVREASLIVGSKGETISRIKNETSTRINVSENIKGVPERVVYFRGSCENVAKAFGKVSRILSGAMLQEEKENKDIPKKSAEEGDKDIENTIPITVHLLIPHHLMGYVIGKHGSRLKEIEELSAARLSASPYQLLPSNDRILKVTGVADALHIATFYVAQTMTNFKDNLRNKKTVFYQPGPLYSVLGKNNHYHNHNNNSNINNNGYRNRNGLSFRGPMYVMVPQSLANGPNNQPGAVYTPETAANAKSFIPTLQIPNVRVVEIPPQPQQPLLQQDVYIDENFVGNIIGKEGKHINSIKETTGCSIFIEGPTKGAKERKLTIKGTPMGSQAAIMLISNKIDLDRNNSNSNSSN
ncbi:similar to Saccharomyces cerevisiae YBR233W PBP2 RNA binding protein with similarity to mammalian heterogeneous nuclear RNP K protein [Maudiozyma barnettii]|uniref:Similar to Saccharomyces cerevisiae YBR233W PBP2 RNA binding protein with similarity to mammalian heterogeneous nuclear RNP K protein n=1 Tax=Maudiozyma barnettii TaxID=61262 RepID=A0A8H2VKF6_9SACH|nr:Pbp2p [Kazachstania barnettii]CAB4257225.1 similar to Saccharomyces cerevisiae YBR233W PBP2 RNA binding protein with similarity to mammalian heterogeneous nuclear RNP K protein [Kazachstania barnettii]CAD1779595.1 similar to Saccharomyces cerevisiae YBR233W PBP2 RNA binding protein with similarity to mammalian heterogeneous nuclear RNP K protein [Kazachstania barnettii]